MSPLLVVVVVVVVVVEFSRRNLGEASPSLEPGQVKICVVDREATRVTGGFARSRFVRDTTLDATPGDVT